MIRKSRIVVGITLLVFLFPFMAIAQERDAVSRLTRQLGSAVPTQKVQAAGQLAKLGKSASSATELLIACLDDTDPDVRLYCSYALAEVSLDYPRTVKALLPVLADKNEHVRYSAEWSIAKLARTVENDAITNDSQLASLQSSFEAALSRLAKQDHQPRHAQAIQSALDSIVALRSKVTDAVAGNQRSKAEAEALAATIATLQKQLAAGDRVQRLLLIESIRTQHLQKPEVVFQSLASILSADDPALVQFAATRWNEAGHTAMKRMLLEIQDDQLPAWISTLLSNIAPDDRQLFERILGLSLNRRLATDIRFSALESLGKTTVDKARAQAALLSVVLERAELEELRLVATRSLSELGELPVAQHTPLIASLKMADENEFIKQEITYSLHSFAPNSKEAVALLAAQLSSLDSNDAKYVELANAIKQYGPLASVALKPLIAGLKSSEEFIRVACAQAIGELGEVAVPATGPLVGIITDPAITVSTKSDVAKVLKQIGSRAALVLVEKINSDNPLVREHVLRSLAVMGPVAKSAVQPCLDRLADQREETSVRVAAALAVGSFGPADGATISTLQTATADSEEFSLRVAALLALAQVQPSVAAPRIAAFANDDPRELRIGAAFAKHLCGSTVDSFNDLMQLTEYSNNSVIQDTLLDLGQVIMPLLVDKIRDASATDEQRITCIRVASQMHPTDWTPMIESLGNERLGQDFFEAILGGWDFDENLLPQLMVALQNERTPTSAKARMLQLAEYITSDLGAGGDADEWSGSYALTRHLQDAAGERFAAAAEMQPEPSETIPPAIPLPEEPQLQIPDPLSMPPASPLASVNDRLVKVYYGTNRQPTNVTKSLAPSKQTPASGYGATIGLAIAAMATCCFGFMRRKSPKYTLAAMTGLAAVTTLAVQSIRFSDTATVEIENVEYGAVLSETVEMGICEVTIPESHRPGELESPSLLLRLEVKEDPEKHIVLKSVHRLEPNVFFEDMHKELDQKGKNVLVFVHGYNVSFEDAARRTAQMAFDLKFPGAPVFYSWPSQANWYGYRADSENIKNSVDQIKSFLTEIASRSNATSINLVAHSMGNVGLTSALAKMNDTKFNQIVLAAPDIDAETFKHDIAPKIVARGNRVTLYTSKTDLALIASKYFNRGPRVGDSGSELILYPGIQTIDATAVDSSLLGHSYYGSNVNVLYDLGQLLSGKSIESREYLRPNSDVTRPYWYFEPSQTASRLSIPTIPLRR